MLNSFLNLQILTNHDVLLKTVSFLAHLNMMKS